MSSIMKGSRTSMFRKAASSATTKRFTTEARVHPGIQPYLQQVAMPKRNVPLRWVPPVLALVAAAYAANTYRESVVQRHLTQSIESERQAHESRELASKLMTAYGEGESLEDIERAVAVYEASRRG